MRIMTVAFALGAAALFNLLTLNVAAQAQSREQRERPLVRVPIVKATPIGITILFHDIVIALRTTGSIRAAAP